MTGTDPDESTTVPDPHGTRAWWAKEQERRERYYAEESAKWFASVKEGDTVPDLDFDTPLCSICTRSTCYEDGQFYCETCNVWWPQTGYGSEATRYDEDGNVVPLSGRTDREGFPCPSCGHLLSAYDWCPACLSHQPPPSDRSQGGNS